MSDKSIPIDFNCSYIGETAIQISALRKNQFKELLDSAPFKVINKFQMQEYFRHFNEELEHFYFMLNSISFYWIETESKPELQIIDIPSKLLIVRQHLMNMTRMAFLANKLYQFCAEQVFGYSTREIAYYSFNKIEFKMCLLRQVEEAVDFYNSVSYITVDEKILKEDFANYISGVGAMFMSD